MYRGSRLAASFLLVLTGASVAAFALSVLPGRLTGGAWVAVPVAISFAVAHFAALIGLSRGKAWARTLGITIAEVGGGLSFAAVFAVALGADVGPAGESQATIAALFGWFTAMYALLGVCVGRIQLTGWARRSHWWPTPLLRSAS